MCVGNLNAILSGSGDPIGGGCGVADRRLEPGDALAVGHDGEQPHAAVAPGRTRGRTKHILGSASGPAATCAMR